MDTNAKKSNQAPTQWENDCVVSLGWMRQFRYFCRMYDMIKDVQGDVVECGVGRGTTFTMLAYLVGAECVAHDRASRTLRGFDSFEGFPEPVSVDKSWRDPKKGEWKVSESITWNRLRDSKITESFPDLSIVITPGFLEQTLPTQSGYTIAFLHLDVDIYPSYRDGLRHLFPLVSPGGVVLFDEYREFSKAYSTEEKWPGATKAIDEYLRPLGYQPELYPETGKYFVVKR